MTLSSPLLLVLGLLTVAGLLAGVLTLTRRRTKALAASGLSTGSRKQPGGWVALAGIAVLGKR